MNKESIWSHLQSVGGDPLKVPLGLTGEDIYYYEITDSTNVRAWEERRQSTGNGALFVADDQTQGKGRRGRQWVDTPGCNLCFSLRLRPKLEPDKVSMLTLVMALSVAEAVETLAGLECGIKWPNDILVRGQKICGILTELKLQGSTMECLIIGVGVNVKPQQFPEELLHKAGALEVLCGREIGLEPLLAGILKEFDKNYHIFLSAGDMSSLQAAYENRMLNKQRPVRVLDPAGAYEGLALGITTGGELLVQRADGGLEQVYAGEVSLRGQDGYF